MTKPEKLNEDTRIDALDPEQVKLSSTQVLESALEAVKSGKITQVVVLGLQEAPDEDTMSYAVMSGMALVNQARISAGFAEKVHKMVVNQFVDRKLDCDGDCDNCDPEDKERLHREAGMH